MKRDSRKGFTMAELLIVVAIVAVLVAIAIPVFSAQLEKSREGVDLANIRNAYATVSIYAMEHSSVKNNGGENMDVTEDAYSLTVCQVIDYTDGVGDYWGIFANNIPLKQKDVAKWNIDGEIGGVSVENIYVYDGGEGYDDMMNVLFQFDPDSLQLKGIELQP